MQRQTDVRQDQGSGDLLPSLDGFDITMGPEMLKAIQVASPAKDGEAEGPEPNPYGNPYGQPPPQGTSAGFGIRLLAALLDGIWMTAAGVAAGLLSGPQIGGMAASGLSFVVVLFGWAIWGTTPGKRACHLHISTGSGAQAGIGFPRALLRMVGYVLSTALLGIGFLMIAFQASNRGLHDIISGTEVRRQK